MAAFALDEVEGLLGNPALLAVGDGNLAPLFEAVVEDFDLTSLVKDEKIVAVVGRCTLDCDGRSRDDSTCMNLLEIVLLHGANVGKYAYEQKQNCR